MPVCLKGARTGESCRGRTSSVMLKQKDVYQSRETKQQFKRASFGLQDNRARVKENIHNL